MKRAAHVRVKSKNLYFFPEYFCPDDSATTVQISAEVSRCLSSLQASTPQPLHRTSELQFWAHLSYWGQGAPRGWRNPDTVDNSAQPQRFPHTTETSKIAHLWVSDNLSIHRTEGGESLFPFSSLFWWLPESFQDVINHYVLGFRF